MIRWNRFCLIATAESQKQLLRLIIVQRGTCPSQAGPSLFPRICQHSHKAVCFQIPAGKSPFSFLFPFSTAQISKWIKKRLIGLTDKPYPSRLSDPDNLLIRYTVRADGQRYSQRYHITQVNNRYHSYQVQVVHVDTTTNPEPQTTEQGTWPGHWP
jgi:hypothetical protein